MSDKLDKFFNVNGANLINVDFPNKLSDLQKKVLKKAKDNLDVYRIEGAKLDKILGFILSDVEVPEPIKGRMGIVFNNLFERLGIVVFDLEIDFDESETDYEKFNIYLIRLNLINHHIMHASEVKYDDVKGILVDEIKKLLENASVLERLIGYAGKRLNDVLKIDSLSPERDLVDVEKFVEDILGGFFD